MRWYRNKLHRKFLCSLAVGLLCCGLVGEGAIRWIGHNALSLAEAEATMRVGLRADASSYLMESNLRGMTAMFELVEDRMRLLAAGKSSRAAIEERLVTLASRGSFGVFQVAIIDPDGINRWSSFAGIVEVDLSDRPHFGFHVAANIGMYVSRPLVGRVSGQRSIQVSRRLNLPDGGFGGVAVLSIDPELLGRQLARLTGPAYADIMLIRDYDASLLARQRSNQSATWEKIRHRFTGAPDETDFRMTNRPSAEDWFVARRVLAGTPLAIVATGEARGELAGLNRLFRVLDISRVVMLAALAAVAAWLMAARARASAAGLLMSERASAAERARILDSMSFGVAILHAAPGEPLRSSFTNRRWAAVRALSGGPEDTTLLLAPPLTQPEIADILDSLRKRGKADLERRYHSLDGKLRWCRLKFSVLNATEKTLEILTVCADIETEKAAAAAAISASRLASLGEVSAGLAHELSQPLSVISLSAEITRMLMTADSIDGAALAQMIERQEVIVNMVARAKTITDHLRTFARKEEDDLQAVAPQAVMHGACLLMEGALLDDGVTLTVDVPAALPEVWGKQVPLEHVLMNLLLNARDAMVELPAHQRQVRVEGSVVGDRVEVSVLDNGPGIPEAVLGRLFEPFYTTKAVGKGTGLGLSICFGTMKACGGSITAANRPEGGAVFTLSFAPAGAAAASQSTHQAGRSRTPIATSPIPESGF